MMPSGWCTLSSLTPTGRTSRSAPSGFALRSTSALSQIPRRWSSTRCSVSPRWMYGVTSSSFTARGTVSAFSSAPWLGGRRPGGSEMERRCSRVEVVWKSIFALAAMASSLLMPGITDPVSPGMDSTEGALSVITRSMPVRPVMTEARRRADSSSFSCSRLSSFIASASSFLRSAICVWYTSSVSVFVLGPGGFSFANFFFSFGVSSGPSVRRRCHMSDQPWRSACSRVRHSGRLLQRRISLSRSLSIWRLQSSRRSVTACSALMIASGVHPSSSSAPIPSSTWRSLEPSGRCLRPTVCARRSSLTRISSSATSCCSAWRTREDSLSMRAFSSIAFLSASIRHCALSSFSAMRVSASSRPTSSRASRRRASRSALSSLLAL
mmetsp:Transcript_7253/g.14747  ORF Transcript_7253/g.14747 Transcript_7253/m.14747 type:complete len:381 (+) Transcript_7253:533-1675(+)